VDWCEQNYAHTPWVAEWWNTTSSLALVAAGLLGLWLHRRVLPRRFLLALGLLALVGVGSVAFHGTLRFGLQMLDELPMLYLVMLMAYVLLEDGPAPRFGRRLPVGLLLYACLVTALCASARGRVQFALFHATFGSLEVFSLWRVVQLGRRLQDAGGRRLFHAGMAAYALAVAVWFVDLLRCDWVGGVLPRLGLPNPQLHAWWHLGVSFGFYALLLVIALRRLQVLGRPARVRWLGGVLPVVEGVAGPAGVRAHPGGGAAG
jgi:dihydroceramidase